MQRKNDTNQASAGGSSVDVLRSLAIREQMGAILASPMFRASFRSRKFLEYVVESALNGRIDQLKERTLGIEVFGRHAAYDTGDDAVVRVTASEVRKRLREYYSSRAPGRVRINLPSGSYVPEFRFTEPGVGTDVDLDLPTPSPPAHDRLRWVKTALWVVVVGCVLAAGWIAGRLSLKPTLQPYGGTPWPLPGIVQAEDFDIGGQEVAYHTDYNTNFGKLYRTSEGVSIEASKDIGGGYDVAWTTAGEWLNFTVNVIASDDYAIHTRVSCNCSGGTFHYNVDGVPATPEIAVPNTGDWQNWTTVSAPIKLSAGRHVVRLVMDHAGSTGAVANFNWFSVENANAITPQ